MTGNWVLDNLNNSLGIWNEKLTEIWNILTQTPQSFKGGAVWDVMTDINGAVQAIAYSLLVLFFVIGVVRTSTSYMEIRRPEKAVRLFIRFAIAKGIITYGMELILALFRITQGIMVTVMDSSGFTNANPSILPDSVITAVNNTSFFESIPIWIISLIGCLVILILSFILILSVYGRFFKIYMYTALAPLPAATLAGEPTQNIGRHFMKNFCAVLLEGAVIALACIIYSSFISGPPVVDETAAAATQVWSYLGEMIFNMLVLVGAVRMSDRVIKEMLGL